jgi:hypothetical protein
MLPHNYKLSVKPLPDLLNISEVKVEQEIDISDRPGFDGDNVKFRRSKILHPEYELYDE